MWVGRFSSLWGRRHVGQGAQAQAWSLRDGEPAFGQQRPGAAGRRGAAGAARTRIAPPTAARVRWQAHRGVPV